MFPSQYNYFYKVLLNMSLNIQQFIKSTCMVPIIIIHITKKSFHTQNYHFDIIFSNLRTSL